MTDNPSSSVPVSKGEEIAREWWPDLAGMVGSYKTRRLIVLIDSALASQEARHRQEMEEAKRENERLQASYEAGIRVRRQLEETIRGTDQAHAETSRILGEQRARAEAAEQREREAIEHKKKTQEILVTIEDLIGLLKK